jgi:hypothetical protein
MRPVTQSGGSGGGQEIAADDPQLTATVRLLHRRHGWSVTAGCAFFAAAFGYAAYLNGQNEGATPPSWWLPLVWATFALMVVALVIVSVDSRRLSSRPGELRASALAAVARHGKAAHHPLRVHAHRFPPRHFLSFVCVWLVLLIVVLMGVLGVAGLPDGIAYLAGAGRTATFTGQSYQQTCQMRTGCLTETIGVLSRPGAADVSATWPSQVPLGQSFKVREPVWSFGFGGQLISGTRTAIVAIVLSLFLDGFAILSVFWAVHLIRNWLRHRRQGAAV